ncbi:phenylalanine--tRNA ligase beta subunit-related protein [Micromonospora sp. FIMYZ51]|uniref:B3/B4 domain-containing protein n=1 Tax=Micromonospora sp. FIMYZ51 TaxID=3051832 RepID=UPI00311DE9B5
MTAQAHLPVAEVSVTPPVAAAFPDVRVLCVEADVGGGAAIAEVVQEHWAQQHGRWHGVGKAEIRSHPAIDAYRRFSRQIGVDPDRQPPSIQALIERGLRTKPLGNWPKINPTVDAVNVTAVATMVALGVFDADRLSGPVKLALSQGGERLQPIGAQEELELEPERLILADDARVLSLFAHRDGVHQAVRSDTRRVLLLACVVDGIAPDHAVEALRHCADLLNLR